MPQLRAAECDKQTLFRSESLVSLPCAADAWEPLFAIADEVGHSGVSHFSNSSTDSSKVGRDYELA
jgi:hypothetical protein